MVGTIVTAKGRILIAKMVAMEGSIRFTRAAVGTGSIPQGYDFSYLNDLNQYKMDGKITGAASNQETASITFQIASKDVEEGFIITEAGLYAEDPDEGEILYAYLDMEDDPQYIYPRGGNVNKVAEITLGVVIGQVERITAIISPGGLVTREQFEKLEQKTDACKTKLDGIEERANRYVHPETHPAEMITGDTTHRFVSDMEKKAWDDTYRQSTAYTDEKIADLINGAPETLDTLGEIAKAMKENGDVVEALNEAIGSKASGAEFDSHKKVTEELLGNTDISEIGDGTVTGAINELNTGIVLWENPDTTVNFNAQTVQLADNYANFKYVELLVKESSRVNVIISSGKIPIFTGVTLQCNLAYTYNHYRRASFDGRTAYITDTRVVTAFGSPEPNPPQISNDALVPWRIVGYR